MDGKRRDTRNKVEETYGREEERPSEQGCRNIWTGRGETLGTRLQKHMDGKRRDPQNKVEETYGREEERHSEQG